MVAGLLRIAQDSSEQCKDAHRGKQFGNRKQCLNFQKFQYGIAAENRDKGGTEIAYKTHEYCKDHVTGKRSDQSDQARHDGKAASSPLVTTAVLLAIPTLCLVSICLHARKPSFP